MRTVTVRHRRGCGPREATPADIMRLLGWLERAVAKRRCDGVQGEEEDEEDEDDGGGAPHEPQRPLSQGGRVAYVVVRTGKMRVAARTFGGACTNQANLVISDSLRVTERAKNFVKHTCRQRAVDIAA